MIVSGPALTFQRLWLIFSKQLANSPLRFHSVNFQFPAGWAEVRITQEEWQKAGNHLARCQLLDERINEASEAAKERRFFA